mmetsp:Transcript_51836/g.110784  ORF Transcript_51836/g.110784 Transcript_51836/m.110784 type:complete len:231 (-) Transcript_51836:107-799(-)
MGPDVSRSCAGGVWCAMRRVAWSMAGCLSAMRAHDSWRLPRCGELDGESEGGASPGDVEDEHHAVDAAPLDTGRAVHDARVVEEGVAVGRDVATSLEEGHVVVAQRASVLGVRALAAQRAVGVIRVHPLSARAAVRGDQPVRDAVLVPGRAAVVGQRLEADGDGLAAGELGEDPHQPLDVGRELVELALAEARVLVRLLGGQSDAHRRGRAGCRHEPREGGQGVRREGGL